MLKTFTNLDVKQIDTNLTLKCIDLLISLLWDFILNEKELIKHVMENKESIIMKSINLVDLICDYSIAMEKKRGYSLEELTRRISLNK